MRAEIKIFPTPHDLAKNFAEELVKKISESAKTKNNLTVALSGGSTPELLFTMLGENYSKSLRWDYVHFFWGDERCVSPDDPESNYGMTRKRLFEKIDIPAVNIHRIRGEDDPDKEILRYSGEILAFTTSVKDKPRFDIIILGLGEDGHTASIFPGQENLFKSDMICDVAMHPDTGQKRITITGSIINNADSVVFLVTGTKKAEIVKKIINKSDFSENYPASLVKPDNGMLRWFLDKEAGSLL